MVKTGRPLKFTTAQVIEALRGTRGIKSAAAVKLGCDWMTVDNYIRRFPTVAQVFRVERERLVDDAELGLLGGLRTIRDPETNMVLREPLPWAVKFVLVTLGKDRGWIERQEVALGASQDLPRLVIELVDGSEHCDDSGNNDGTDKD